MRWVQVLSLPVYWYFLLLHPPWEHPRMSGWEIHDSNAHVCVFTHKHWLIISSDIFQYLFSPYPVKHDKQEWLWMSWSVQRAVMLSPTKVFCMEAECWLLTSWWKPSPLNLYLSIFSTLGIKLWSLKGGSFSLQKPCLPPTQQPYQSSWGTPLFLSIYRSSMRAEFS